MPDMRKIVLVVLGALLFAPLASLPSYAAGPVRSAVSLTGPASGTYGSTVVLHGTLWRYGTSTRILSRVHVLCTN